MAVALPALVLSLYSGIRPMADTVTVDAVAGGVAIVLGLGSLALRAAARALSGRARALISPATCSVTRRHFIGKACLN